MIFLKSYFVNTTVGVDILPITHDVRYAIRDAGVAEALVTVIVPGAGASVLVFEPVSEVIEELRVLFEMFAGEGGEGTDKKKERVFISPRIQAAVFPRSISIPLKNSKLILDPYEEVYLIDFDRKAKRRELFVQVLSIPEAAPQGPGRMAPPPKKK